MNKDHTFAKKLITRKAMVVITDTLPTLPSASDSRLEMQAAAEYNLVLRRMAVQMTSYLEAIPDHEIRVDRKWPADWWQAFKERWLPKWALTRWPVKYDGVYVREMIYKAVCPHISGEPTSVHTEWLVQHQD